MSGSARTDDLKQKFHENPGRHFAALANEYRKSGELDKAIELCREHLTEQPRHLSGNVVLGKALFARGDRSGARGAFEAALITDSDNVDALHQLALLARDEGQGVLALDYARRALAVDPQDPELLAMASDLSAPPDEDVAPPSFDPRSMFEDHVAAVAPPSTNPLSRSRAVDELLKDLPPDEAPEGGKTPESDLEGSVGAVEGIAEPGSAAEVSVGEAEAGSSAEFGPSPEVGSPEAAGSFLEAEGDDKATVASDAASTEDGQSWDDMTADDVELPDHLISDWQGAGREEAASPDVSEAPEPQLTEDAPVSAALPAADAAVDAPAPDTSVAGSEFEAFEFTPPERSPKTTPHGDALVPLVEPDYPAASEADFEVPEAAEPEPEADAETPAIAEAAPETDVESPALAGQPEAEIRDDEWGDPSLTTPMAGVEAIARDENNTADAGGTVDWPDLEWPAEDATAPVADAEEARQDVVPEVVPDVVPDAVPDAVTEVVPDAVPDAVPEIATASAPPQDAPADPPLTHLPEEAEVPAEDRVAFATETMAEILVSQGRHEDARQLYEQIMNRRPQDVGVRQRMESLMQATKGPAANVPQATGIPMRELMSRILAYTPPGSAGSVTPPDAIQAQGPTTTGDARAAAARTIAGMMAESEQDAERAARTFADAAAALGDPAVAQQLAATVESQPEPISAVLARVAAESPEPAHGAGTSQRITPRQAPTFSFDQFFRDAMPEEETPAPPDVASTGTGEAALPQADDDDGFRAWLDGLRKS